MRLFSILCFLSALFAIPALADEKIAFTSVPANVVVGHSYNITWGGGDGSSVTITLRKGDLSNLQTIQILATNYQSSSYIWRPNSTLLNGDDYTLQITQGLDGINFSGEFQLSGGIDPVSASISSILASASAAIASANASITSLAHITSSLAAASSSGTGIPISRNTTFSSATLGPSSQSASKTTSSSVNATSSPSGNGGDALVSRHASSLALFCAVLASVAYAI